MASTSSATLSIPSSSTLVDAKPPRHSPIPSTQCVSLPPSLSSSPNRLPFKATTYCRKVARNVMTMATGEAPPTELAATEMPEIFKSVQDAWDKAEDKYALSSLAVAGVVALVGTSGMMSAIDRLPLIPGVLEVVGIGYTGWFAYKNLVFTPEREALISKIKGTYKDIIGSS